MGVEPSMKRIVSVTFVAGLLGLPATPSFAQQPPPLPGSAEEIALACAPRATHTAPTDPIRIVGGTDVVERRIYGRGDTVSLSAGSDDGVAVGQKYFTRRILTDAYRAPSRQALGNVRTTGWVTVTLVEETKSLATVTYSCDTVDTGDYLEPFELPAIVSPDSSSKAPASGNFATVLFGLDNRKAVGIGDFFVINQGTDHGVTSGARFAIYREPPTPRAFRVEVGEAVAVQVSPESSTLRMTHARSAVIAGDLAAIRK